MPLKFTSSIWRDILKIEKIFSSNCDIMKTFRIREEEYAVRAHRIQMRVQKKTVKQEQRKYVMRKFQESERLVKRRLLSMGT